MLKIKLKVVFVLLFERLLFYNPKKENNITRKGKLVLLCLKPFCFILFNIQIDENYELVIKKIIQLNIFNHQI